MREIKFRAWDKKRKLWIDKDRDWVINNVGEVWVYNFQCGGYVNGETKDTILMQFTGLKDKNGNEIYEGDIVVMTIRENIGTFNVPDDIIVNGGYTGKDDIYKGEVIFKDFGFCINDKESGEFYLQPMEDTFFEVIGNIYENPKLLGGA